MLPRVSESVSVVSVMKSVLLVLSQIWVALCGPGNSSVHTVAPHMDLARVLRRVDRRFLSVTIDASLAEEEKFMYLLSSRKVRTLAKELSPAFLRFGGTRQDFMEFTPGQRAGGAGSESCEDVLPPAAEEALKSQWTTQRLVLMKEDLQRSYRRVHFTESTVDLLHSFSNCSGFHLIFGLNALLRRRDNSWNSSNARSLLEYCEARRYRMSWELGNEPNSYEKKAGVRVDGHQLGLDFIRLRQLMSEFELYLDAGLFGPDVGQPRDHRVDILKGFLQTGSDAVDAITWHHYYVNGRYASLEDFLDPEVLDSLQWKIREVLKTVARVKKPVWLGETSSAYGGGAPGLSDTFAAGFMWMDKLGLAARSGLDVVMRQVLIGSGSYHLIDDDMNPLPDYWLSLLYKRLVGPEVLSVRGQDSGESKRVRVYLHCASRTSYSAGAVTLLGINLRVHRSRIQLPRLLSSSTVQSFILQSARPGEEGLNSRQVMLNGVVLKMVDEHTLPELKGRVLPPYEHLLLPAFSLGYFVFPDAAAPACL
ncbi:heparanase [Neosynchiropus ocellatus]